MACDRVISTIKQGTVMSSKSNRNRMSILSRVSRASKATWGFLGVDTKKDVRVRHQAVSDAWAESLRLTQALEKEELRLRPMAINKHVKAALKKDEINS